MSRAIVFAFMILSFNMALVILNSIDSTYSHEKGVSLFGQITPYASYGDVKDIQGNTINFSDRDSMENASNTAMSFDATAGNYFDLGGWITLKTYLETIFNFLYYGFFGLADFLYTLGMPSIFVSPVKILIGIIQIIGIYEVIRGGTL